MSHLEFTFVLVCFFENRRFGAHLPGAEVLDELSQIAGEQMEQLPAVVTGPVHGLLLWRGLFQPGRLERITVASRAFRAQELAGVALLGLFSRAFAEQAKPGFFFVRRGPGQCWRVLVLDVGQDFVIAIGRRRWRSWRGTC